MVLTRRRLPLLVALTACAEGGEECDDPIAWDEEGAVLDLTLEIDREESTYIDTTIEISCEVRENLSPGEDALGSADVGECTRIYTRPTPPGKSILKVNCRGPSGDTDTDVLCDAWWYAPLDPGLNTLKLAVGCQSSQDVD